MNGFPPPKITWSKDRGSLPALAQQQDGQLKIINVRKQNSGLYNCEASNLLGLDVARTLLTVVVSPKFIIKPPEVLSITKGEDVSAVCRATGDPRPIVTWSKVNGELPTGKSHVLADGTLKITSAAGEDAGKYICTASVMGIFKSQAQMQLDIKRK